MWCQIHNLIRSQIYCDTWTQIHSHQLHSSKYISTVSSEVQSLYTSEPRSTAMSKARSTWSNASCMLPDYPDPLLPAKPVSPLPAKPDPPLPACSQRGQIIREVRVSMSEWWDQACQSCKSKYVRLWEQAYQWWKQTCQSCESEARSKASCQLIAIQNSLPLAMPDPPLSACSLWTPN